MIIYVIDGGYGPEPGQLTDVFPPAAIVLLAALLAWAVSRALSAGTGNPVPQIGGPRWVPPVAQLVDPREVRRLRAEVDAEWTSYCMDPYSIFIRPLLDDVTEPATERFFHCRERVELLAPLAETPIASTDRRIEYQQAVLDLADAWHAADVNARSVGTARMDLDTKRALSRARQLINRAIDERTTAGERENCRLKLIELLNGLAPIPGPLRQRVAAHLGNPSLGQLAR
jgi:hypothetical protein